MQNNDTTPVKKLHIPKTRAPSIFIEDWLCQVPIKELSLGAKMLYGRLAQWSVNGEAYRSAKQLAAELGISPRTIQKYTLELKAVGLIETSQPQAGGLNHFRFYHHEWMEREVVKELTYKEDKKHHTHDRAYGDDTLRTDVRNPTHDRAQPYDRSCVPPTHDRAVINKKEREKENNNNRDSFEPVQNPTNLPPEHVVVFSSLVDQQLIQFKNTLPATLQPSCSDHEFLQWSESMVLGFISKDGLTENHALNRLRKIMRNNKLERPQGFVSEAERERVRRETESRLKLQERLSREKAEALMAQYKPANTLADNPANPFYSAAQLLKRASLG